MTFKIICAGWNCADFLQQTLVSIQQQSITDWEVMIVDDASDDPRQAALIRLWCDSHGDRWHYQINDTHRGTPRNQHDGIRALNPADDDIIVFLDLDGDRLAHPRVLQLLLGYYADGTLVTYGSYKAVPDTGTSVPARPFPRSYVKTNDYRSAVNRGVACFNHLRTMKGKVFRAIPEKVFHWNGDINQPWYEHGTDYIFMISALELAGGNYKCIPEILCLYNHNNPNADYLIRSADSPRCTQNFLLQPPLLPMKGTPVALPTVV